MLTKNRTLKYLDVSFNDITRQGAQLFRKPLEENVHLAYLFVKELAASGRLATTKGQHCPMIADEAKSLEKYLVPNRSFLQVRVAFCL